VTLILKTNPTSPDPDILRRAAEILRRGGIVAFPTETVYGLGAVVYNEDAVRKVYIAKMRPPDNPLIVHISRESMLEEVAINIPEKAYKLINKFWPGPLTLILPRSPNIPKIVTGGLDVVAVRMPAHPVALGLINEVGSPIAAPSANLAGRPSPTTAEHVIRDLYGRIDAVIDAGETLYGVESTILNILTDPPTLLRPGAYPVEEIERVLDESIYIPPFARGFAEAERALAPGMKYRHYAPETPLLLVEPRSGDLEAMVSTIRSLAIEHLDVGEKVCIVASTETVDRYRDLPVELLVIGSRQNMFEVAKNLFKTLRRLDDLNCTIGIVEGFEEKGLGLTVMNRLRKASKTKIPV
jgi:L-threonylcarbamoyladenylate synthase